MSHIQIAFEGIPGLQVAIRAAVGARPDIDAAREAVRSAVRDPGAGGGSSSLGVWLCTPCQVSLDSLSLMCVCVCVCL